MAQLKMNEYMMQKSQLFADQYLTQTPLPINLDYMASPLGNHHYSNYEQDPCMKNGWEKLEDAQNVISNVQHAFDTEVDVDLIGCEGNEIVFNRSSLQEQFQPHSPQASITPPLVTTNTAGQYTDAQTIAFLLQKQLDEIDKEIRLIKEEKQNAQLRTEEIGLRVGWADLNNDDQTPVQYATNSLKSTTSSGRSTPQQNTKHNTMLNRHVFDMNTQITGTTSDFTSNLSQSILANYPSWNNNTVEHSQKPVNDEPSRYIPSRSPMSSTNSSDDSLNRLLNNRKPQTQQDSLNKKRLLKKPFFRLFSSQRKKSQKELLDCKIEMSFLSFCQSELSEDILQSPFYLACSY
jgi:hypothetical protein